MWRFLVFTVFFFSLTNGINYEQVFASDTMVLPSDSSNMEYRLFNLTAGDIETAEIALFTDVTCLPKTKLYVGHNLRKVHKDDVTPYNGPTLKGGPLRVTLFLKTNEKFTLVLNGRHLLFGWDQVYLPEMRKFAKQVISKYSKAD